MFGSKKQPTSHAIGDAPGETSSSDFVDSVLGFTLTMGAVQLSGWSEMRRHFLVGDERWLEEALIAWMRRQLQQSSPATASRYQCF